MIAAPIRRPAGSGATIAIGLLALALVAEVAANGALATGRTSLVAVLAVGVTFGLSFAFWRHAVYGVLVLLFVEGYARNYLNTPAVLLVKDVALLAIYVRLIGDRVYRRLPLIPASPLTLPLAVFAGIVVAQMANPNVTSFEQSLVGVRTWLYYVPLYFVALEMIDSEGTLRRLVRFVLLCAVPICALGFYQYIQGSDAYASLGPGFAGATFRTGSGIDAVFRPNSTFAWSSNFALFLALSTLLCLGLLMGSRGRLRWALAVLLVGLVAADVVENQRTLLVLLPPLALVAAMLRRSTGTAAMTALVVVLGLVVVALIASPGTFMRVDGLMRNQDGVFHVRAMTYVDHFRLALGSPIGYGTGATALGTRYVAGNIPLFVEFSLAKVAGDLSLLGLAAYLWMFLALLRTTLKAHRRAGAARWQSTAGLCAAVFAYQLLVLYVGYDLAVVAIPFWFLSGAMARIAMSDPARQPAEHGGPRPWR